MGGGRAAGRRLGCSGCCGSTSCSNGMGWPTRRWRMRCTTAKLCAGFAGIDLNRDPVADATTLLKFRHWLERHELTKVLFDEIGAMLAERGLLMRRGTIVDATIIAAPPSTKNQEKAPDPQMPQTT